MLIPLYIIQLLDFRLKNNSLPVSNTQVENPRPTPVLSCYCTMLAELKAWLWLWLGDCRRFEGLCGGGD